MTRAINRIQGGSVVMNEFKKNVEIFCQLVDSLPRTQNDKMNALISGYIEQNLMIINEMLITTIENMQRLQHAKTTNDVICMHAKFTNDISKQLNLSAQRFMNTTLGHISDYNEWLKLHCDLATD